LIAAGIEFGNFGSISGLFRRSARDGCAALAPLKTKGCAMFGWVVTFLIIALIAGVLGFGGIAGASIEIAKVIFVIAIILFLISAVVGLVRGRSRV
jgi:uncharacterized membrane protein YtjA (UPF0391 family)